MVLCAVSGAVDGMANAGKIARAITSRARATAPGTFDVDFASLMLDFLAGR